MPVNEYRLEVVEQKVERLEDRLARLEGQMTTHTKNGGGVTFMQLVTAVSLLVVPIVVAILTHGP